MDRTRGRGVPPAVTVRFVAGAAGWVVGLLALLRLSMVQRYLLLPLAAAQQTVASQIIGAPSGAVVLDASCSAADVTALCLGVIFAFPAPWWRRLRGAAAGLLLIAGLNTLRIGHLSLVADDRALLDLLHVYVWPAVLTFAVSAFAFTWLRHAAAAGDAAPVPIHPGRRFLVYAGGLTGVYFAITPRLFESGALERASTWVAAGGGAAMSALGATVVVSGAAVSTSRGTFVVTPECLVTPLIVVYLAATLAAPLRRASKALALAAAPLAFGGLGTLRLLVLAVPAPLVSSPMAAVHGFSQVLVGVLLVGAASFWMVTVEARRREGAVAVRPTLLGARRTAAALGAGVATSLIAATVWTLPLEAGVAAVQAAVGHAGHAFNDAQGALRALPAYQVGLMVALWVALLGVAPPVVAEADDPSCRRPRYAHWLLPGRGAWRSLALGLAGLAASQVVLLAGTGELSHHLGFRLHTSLIRAWAIAAPVAGALLMERSLLDFVRTTAVRSRSPEALHEATDPS